MTVFLLSARVRAEELRPEGLDSAQVIVHLIHAYLGSNGVAILVGRHCTINRSGKAGFNPPKLRRSNGVRCFASRSSVGGYADQMRRLTFHWVLPGIGGRRL